MGEPQALLDSAIDSWLDRHEMTDHEARRDHHDWFREMEGAFADWLAERREAMRGSGGNPLPQG